MTHAVKHFHFVESFLNPTKPVLACMECSA